MFGVFLKPPKIPPPIDFIPKLGGLPSLPNNVRDHPPLPFPVPQSLETREKALEFLTLFDFCFHSISDFSFLVYGFNYRNTTVFIFVSCSQSLLLKTVE